MIKEEAKTMSIVRFDSSIGRGDFKTPIGVGKVIKGTLNRPPSTCPEHSLWSVVNGRTAGWDEGVMEMSLGEKSILTITRYEGTTLHLWTILMILLLQRSLTFPCMVWGYYQTITNKLFPHSDYAYGERWGHLPPIYMSRSIGITTLRDERSTT